MKKFIVTESGKKLRIDTAAGAIHLKDATHAQLSDLLSSNPKLAKHIKEEEKAEEIAPVKVK